MKSTKPALSMLAMFLIGSLYALPTLAVDLNTTGGVNATAPGVNTTTSGNATVTTPADPATPATPADPADPADRMDNLHKPDARMKGTNMRNKDCDVNVSANSNSNSSTTNATRNCDDTNKPKK